MKKALVVMAALAAVAVPAAPALADNNPCKGTAPGPHCRPPCFYYVYVDEGDPANGIAPTVEIRETFC
ncbi:MAG TPA: hypothetical protein VHF58_00005 [Solirubrobacterales bacterium]|nr:hypothetical protein [Solirubrobacterales bacterium]